MFARIIEISKDRTKFQVFDENVSSGFIAVKDGFSVGDFIECKIRYEDDNLENHDSYEIVTFKKIESYEVYPKFIRDMMLDEDIIGNVKISF